MWDDGITFHELCLIVGGFFAVIAAGVSFYLIMCHATHYSKPVEQRQYDISHLSSSSITSN